ncbi:MAG TPA: trehalase family glycosidase [Candidatus Dormibacteraeota bacterium]
MLPHLRYDPRFVADYFPGPDWWPRAPRHIENAGVLTSGISNPPVLPIAVRLVGERQADLGRRHDLWRRCLPGLTAWLRWFLDSRRPPGGQLPVVVHPWEAGWDNSPRWDRLSHAGLKPSRPYERLDTRHVAAGERPAGKDYDSYLALAELLDGTDYDAAQYLERTPFAVNDVVVDALWYGAARDVNFMALLVGQGPAFSDQELSSYADAFEAVHWSSEKGTYLDWDVAAGSPIAVESAAAVAALAGGVIPAERAATIWRRFVDQAVGARLVCTVPPSALEFEPARYWRGPVWLNVNWLVIRGLEHAGMNSEAADLRAQSLELVADGGFHEYFDAIIGEGRGIAGFTWTAAVVLDLLG